MGRPKVNKLDHLFETNKEFTLSEDDYKRITGEYLPKSGNYYICHRSAIARQAKKFGYTIVVNTKILTFKKQR